ncbi:SusC/RagA family TonB-linked outer membrane protein [Aliifodinibius salipaludis]|uniref:SusC/RagA family TonB-linked outer membrane protein n=2 Tax=Fodinibius salipaludis TaxID=2032627 RepID=A0A2A2GD85_9BACT|nr:SusC/RagA family TonB-linked outer membrane protein [Aliifodinibius salipaludis]
MKVSHIISLMLFFFCVTGFMSVQAQDMEVSGTVFDGQTEGTLPGVNISVKGTTRGTTTNAEGKYQLSVESLSDTLVFSFVGYEVQEIPIDGRNSINVTMNPTTLLGEEVIVVGYGQQRSQDVTGAISTVSPDDIDDVNTANFGDAIQGLVPGVNVSTTGAPGSEPSVEIRGLGNFSNNEPLYIIDGVPTSANRDFNVNDIESVQILKDASAAAIYGSRAANGVVIITTKSGQEGPMKVEYSSQIGREWLPRFDLMDREQWIDFNNRAYDNAIEAGVTGVTSRQDHMDGNTNWQDETFEPAWSYDQNLTLSGGGDLGTYLISLNTLRNTGTTIGSGSRRYGVRVNTEGSQGIFTFGENLAITSFQVDELDTNPIADVTRMLPTIPVYDEDNPGGYGYGDEDQARTFATNPIAKENLENRETENVRIRGNIFAELDFTDYLNYRLNYGLNYNSGSHNYLRKVGNWTLNQPYDPSRLYDERSEFQSHLIENTLTFDNDFGNHKVNTVLGQSFQTFREDFSWGEGTDLTRVGDDYFTVLDAATENYRTGGYLNEAAISSFFGRLSYNFDDRYIAEFTMRWDGTSRLPEDNRWGSFPSVSGAWRVSNESFFDVNWIDDLKLKASWGQLGSSNIGYYDYQGVLNINPQAVFGEDQQIRNGVTQVELVNQDLRWETLTQTNIGFDARLLDNRLTSSANYYISETEDVLTEMPILMTTGNDGGNPLVNAASLKNTGVEISAKWTEDFEESDFTYSIGVNFNRSRNEILSLGFDQVEFYTWQTKNEVGEPIGMYYLIETNGLFQSDQEVQNHTDSNGDVIQPDAEPGDIRYVDANDDGQITSNDRQIVGSPWPDFEYGLNVTAGYKNFDIRIQGFGAQGFDIFNGPRSVMDRFDDNSNYRKGIDPWTPQNTNTDFPRIIYADQRNSRGDQDRWLEDGSYFKIKNITLGYTVPNSWVENWFDRLRVSVTAQNMITFTGYSGLDPEFSAPNIFRRTHDDYMYPTPKNVTFNLQLSF